VYSQFGKIDELDIANNPREIGNILLGHPMIIQHEKILVFENERPEI